MLRISNSVVIPSGELEMRAIRSQGSGGQNVNKVSTAIHLRFDIAGSSLPELYKERLLRLSDHRITKDGVIVIKSQQYRSQDKNREDALARLRALIRRAVIVPAKRVPTRPPRKSSQKRLEGKTKRSLLKNKRKKVTNSGY